MKKASTAEKKQFMYFFSELIATMNLNYIEGSRIVLMFLIQIWAMFTWQCLFNLTGVLFCILVWYRIVDFLRTIIFPYMEWSLIAERRWTFLHLYFSSFKINCTSYSIDTFHMNIIHCLRGLSTKNVSNSYL